MHIEILTHAISPWTNLWTFLNRCMLDQGTSCLPTYLPTYLPVSCHHVQPQLKTKLLKILPNVVTWGCEAPCPSCDVMDKKLCCIQHEHGVAENTKLNCFSCPSTTMHIEILTHETSPWTNLWTFLNRCMLDRGTFCLPT